MLNRLSLELSVTRQNFQFSLQFKDLNENIIDQTFFLIFHSRTFIINYPCKVPGIVDKITCNFSYAKNFKLISGFNLGRLRDYSGIGRTAKLHAKHSAPHCLFLPCAGHQDATKFKTSRLSFTKQTEPNTRKPSCFHPHFFE